MRCNTQLTFCTFCTFGCPYMYIELAIYNTNFNIKLPILKKLTLEIIDIIIEN